MKKQAISYMPHEDDEKIDYIDVRMVPRFKTSELSGDEWRVSAVVRFGYKGHVIYERTFGDMTSAVASLPHLLLTFREEAGSPTTQPSHHPCDQVGCSEPATILYRMKAIYDHRGHRDELSSPYHRGFCVRHSTRGDCGLDDADENYEVIGSRDSLRPPSSEDKRPSIFGGIIHVGGLEDDKKRISDGR